MKNFLFIKEFIFNMKNIGSLFPSSKYLAKEIVNKIEFNKQNIVIVELGAGTGVFTERIIQQKKDKDILIVLELNETFYNLLKQKFSYNSAKNVIIINDNAVNLPIILQQLKIKKVDYIVSGLPFLNFDEEERKKIFNAITKSLNGDLILFQYTQRLKEKIKNYFKNLTQKRVLLNFPPAYIFVCKNHSEQKTTIF